MNSARDELIDAVRLNIIVDEMLAIREEIDRWRDKKRSREANGAYNELLWYGLEDGQE